MLDKQADNAATQIGMKELYDSTRKITGKHRTGGRPIMNTSGKLPRKQKDQLKRLKLKII